MTSASASMEMVQGGYPVQVEVEGPQQQNRLSVLLRIIFAIPHLIILNVLGAVLEVTGFIAWLIVVITGKYPAGLFKFHTGYVRWAARTYGYVALLTDKYPPFSLEDEAYPIRISAAENLEDRNRVTVFFRAILVIPHLIVLAVLGVVATVVAIIAWVAALITGSVPEGLHRFLAGVVRWGTRVNGYFYMLTDEYPPFSLE